MPYPKDSAFLSVLRTSAEMSAMSLQRPEFDGQGSARKGQIATENWQRHRALQANAQPS